MSWTPPANEHPCYAADCDRRTADPSGLCWHCRPDTDLSTRGLVDSKTGEAVVRSRPLRTEGQPSWIPALRRTTQ